MPDPIQQTHMRHPTNRFGLKTGTWMSQEVGKWLVNGLITPISYNPFTKHFLTS